jgi:hypothetical protein
MPQQESSCYWHYWACLRTRPSVVLLILILVSKGMLKTISMTSSMRLKMATSVQVLGNITTANCAVASGQHSCIDSGPSFKVTSLLFVPPGCQESPWPNYSGGAHRSYIVVDSIHIVLLHAKCAALTRKGIMQRLCKLRFWSSCSSSIQKPVYPS